MVKTNIFAIGLNKKLAFILERTNKTIAWKKHVTVDRH